MDYLWCWTNQSIKWQTFETCSICLTSGCLIIWSTKSLWIECCFKLQGRGGARWHVMWPIPQTHRNHSTNTCQCHGCRNTAVPWRIRITIKKHRLFPLSVKSKLSLSVEAQHTMLLVAGTAGAHLCCSPWSMWQGQVLLLRHRSTPFEWVALRACLIECIEWHGWTGCDNTVIWAQDLEI